MGRDVRVRKSQLQRMIAPPMVVVGTLLALFSLRWGSSTPSPVDPWLQLRRAPLLTSRLRLGATAPTASAKQSFSSELKEAKKGKTGTALKEPPPPPASPPPPPKVESKSEPELTPKAAPKVPPKRDNAAAPSDILDWAGWAKDARKAADEAELKAWSKELTERYTARAQVTTYLAAATALDGVAVAPVWAPYAAVAAGILAIIIAVGSALSVPNPAPSIRPATQAPAVISAPAAAPKANVVPPATLVPPAPPVPPKPEPAPLPPAMPAPTPMPAPIVPKAPVKPAPVVSTAKVQAEPSWGQVAAGALSNTLRSAADALPKVEKDIEDSIPVVQKSVTWLVETRPPNFEQKVAEALPVVGNFAVKGLEFAARTGLQVSSVALDKIADTLPAVGQVVSNAMVDAIPATQETVRNAAAATKALAPKAAELSKTLKLGDNMPEEEIKAVLAQLPMVLNGTASGLEMIADEVPAAERLLVYGTGKALPVVQAALETTSEVAADAAKIDVSQVQLPSGEQVSGALKSVGVDVNQLGAEAKRVAGEASSAASSNIESWFKETILGATDSPPPPAQQAATVAKQVAVAAKKATADTPPTYDALFER